MHRRSLRGLVCLALISLPVLAAGGGAASTADTASATSAADPPISTEERIKRLEAEVEQLKKQQASAQPAAATTPPPPATAASEPAAAAPPAGPAAEAESTPETENAPAPLAPGTGLVLAKSEYGTVKVGIYALFRALDQEPANQTLTDHLGNQTPINTRRDFQLHRIMIPFTGWLYDPKFSYTVTIWTVNDTEQVRVIGAFQYRFAPQFSLGAGIGSMPGTRSLSYNHPFWFGHDRVMADEFFRSGFTTGVWATGDIVPGLFYRVMVGNNISTLGINAAKNTRAFAYGGTMAWMPTTGEFGPAGAYDDFEMHKELATRFGFSIVSSAREDRASQPSASQPDATQIRLADSLLLFQTGALAPGVTSRRLITRLVRSTRRLSTTASRSSRRPTTESSRISCRLWAALPFPPGRARLPTKASWCRADSFRSARRSSCISRPLRSIRRPTLGSAAATRFWVASTGSGDTRVCSASTSRRSMSPVRQPAASLATTSAASPGGSSPGTCR
jgi:hypothetical protein